MHSPASLPYELTRVNVCVINRETVIPIPSAHFMVHPACMQHLMIKRFSVTFAVPIDEHVLWSSNHLNVGAAPCWRFQINIKMQTESALTPLANWTTSLFYLIFTIVAFLDHNVIIIHVGHPSAYQNARG